MLTSRSTALSPTAYCTTLLGSLGAPADRINTRGLGSDFPGYLPDHDPQGNLNPIPAAQNRQVIIELT